VTTLYLARHGETDWNREGRWQGHALTPLNETGREQARVLADRLKAVSLAAIYSSDLPRALETAQIIGSKRGLKAIPDPDLRELDVGSFEGFTEAELDGHQWDGESQEAHRGRVLAAVLRIAGQHPDCGVLVVTHGGSLRRLQEVVLGEPLAVVENCAVWRVVLRDGRFAPLDDPVDDYTS
jgi:phosphoserine phosphatase